MTIREAAIEAQRRMGHSEEEIKCAVAVAELAASGDTELDPGEEERVITDIMDMLNSVKKLALVHAAQARAAKAAQANN